MRCHLAPFLALATAHVASAFVITPQTPIFDGPTIVEDKVADSNNTDTPLPLLIWHGLGDAFNSMGMRRIGELAASIHPGTLVYHIHVAGSGDADRAASWIGNVNEQVKEVCDMISKHKILSTAPALDGLGFSQGGQFLRGLNQRCPSVRLRSLVTFGSQHMGINQFKKCMPTDFLCKGGLALLDGSTWSRDVQSRLVPAQYFRDLKEYDQYLQHSNFLADINNERAQKNEMYKAKTANMTNFIMYLFEADTVAIPRETSWLGEVNGTQKVALRDTTLFRENWLGLQELDKKGGLKFRTTPGEHMHLNDNILREAFQYAYGPLNKAFPKDGPGQGQGEGPADMETVSIDNDVHYLDLS